jgi:hypothetical protein
MHYVVKREKDQNAQSKESDGNVLVTNGEEPDTVKSRFFVRRAFFCYTRRYSIGVYNLQIEIFSNEQVCPPNGSRDTRLRKRTTPGHDG